MIGPLHITTREELRRWYEEKHDAAVEMVIPCSRAKTDKPGIIRYLSMPWKRLCALGGFTAASTQWAMAPTIINRWSKTY